MRAALILLTLLGATVANAAAVPQRCHARLHSSTAVSVQPTSTTVVDVPAVTTTTEAASTETEKPERTSTRSAGSTEAPSVSTEVPSESTAVPSASTAAPSESTEVPSTSTEIPSESTAAPSASTAGPSESTEVPSTSTEIPSESTAAPSASTAAPSESTEVPSASTEIPSESTAAPSAPSPTGTPQVPPTSSVGEGFAFTNGLTTGGATGPTTHVSDLASLTAALSSTSPKTIILTGLLDLTAIRQLHINSHTTLLGSPTIPSGFTGGGLAITKNTTNVIVRNLHFTKPVGIDSIQIQQSSHVWIDHNTFSSDRDHGKDFYDGLLDITHAGDYITVSWNAFSDHFKVSLVGASDDDGDEDTGRLHVTYHHNHFHSVGSRTPSLRFGTGHVYNNLFEDMSSGVHSRMGARVLVENNIFANVTTPVFTTGSKVDGEVLERGNEFGEGKVEITKVAEGMTVPYGYVMDEVVDVRRRVLEGVGAGKLQF